MRPLGAHCRLGLGEFYWRTDRRMQAAEYFTIATRMYRDMGMTYWLEKAEEYQGADRRIAVTGPGRHSARLHTAPDVRPM